MNVTIRPLVEEDAYTSVKWRNDPEVFKFRPKGDCPWRTDAAA